MTSRPWLWKTFINKHGISLFCCSATQSCPTLCHPTDCSIPDPMGCFPVLHHLQEFAQTRVRWVDDAILPSHPLSPSSPPALNISQHQVLFQRGGSSHQVTKVLELQHRFFQWIFRVDFFKDWLVWSLFSPRDSQEFSPTPQFKSINSSVLSLHYSPTLTSIHEYWKNHSLD